MASKTVRVRWDDPRSLKKVLKCNGEDDYGLYQVYSHHVVFGPGSLVYIGKAQEQAFAVRFKDHKREWLSERKWLSEEYGVTIRLGRLCREGYGSEDEWKELLSDTEAFLICCHSPPYNSQHINDYRGQPLHIQNWGNRGSILPECSSVWETPRPHEEQ